MLEKEITVYPKPYHGTHLRAQGETWEAVNKQLLKEFNRIKKTLPADEISLALDLLKNR